MYARDLETIADIAQEIVTEYVNNHTIEIETKADGSKVTSADKHLHQILRDECKVFNLPIISEEDKEHDLEAISKGSYITIDPIDGTNNFIYHAMEQGAYPADLPTLSNHGLLIGIVQNNIPVAGISHNYANGDRVVIDTNFINWSLSEKPTKATHAIYIGKCDTTPELYGKRIIRGGFGLRAVEAMACKIPNTYAHMPNTFSGIWDVVPAMAAARVVNGQSTINGRPIELNKYAYIPEGDVEICKGDYLEKRVFE